jgi:hypothetical protein
MTNSVCKTAETAATFERRDEDSLFPFLFFLLRGKRNTLLFSSFPPGDALCYVYGWDSTLVSTMGPGEGGGGRPD